MVAAKVKYEDTNSQNLASRPCGVVVAAEQVMPHSPMSETGKTFYGISMAPTMSKSEVNIAVAVAGVCTALIAADSKNRFPARHLGTQLYPRGDGKLYFKPADDGEFQNAKPVATYLQKNGIDTALVWLSGIQTIEKGAVIPDEARQEEGAGFTTDVPMTLSSSSKSKSKSRSKRATTSDDADDDAAVAATKAAAKAAKKKKARAAASSKLAASAREVTAHAVASPYSTSM